MSEQGGFWFFDQGSSTHSLELRDLPRGQVQGKEPEDRPVPENKFELLPGPVYPGAPWGCLWCTPVSAPHSPS